VRRSDKAGSRIVAILRKTDQSIAEATFTDQSIAEATFTDLPDVRFTDLDSSSPAMKSYTAIKYQSNRDGVMLPRSIQRTLLFNDQKIPNKVNKTVEAGVFQSFTLTSLEDADPIPLINIEDGIKVIDDCRRNLDRHPLPAPVPLPK
jgi:hypothetical protein